MTELEGYAKMTVRPLSDALLIKARKDIHEEPKRVASDIIALREWLSKQPHLECVQPSKTFIEI